MTDRPKRKRGHAAPASRIAVTGASVSATLLMVTAMAAAQPPEVGGEVALEPAAPQGAAAPQPIATLAPTTAAPRRVVRIIIRRHHQVAPGAPVPAPGGGTTRTVIPAQPLAPQPVPAAAPAPPPPPPAPASPSHGTTRGSG